MKINVLIVTVLTALMVACTSTMEPMDAPIDTIIEQASKEESAPSVPMIIGTKESKETKMTSLEGTSWYSPTLGGVESKLTPYKEQITLQFVDGRISGSAGCNRYFASYTEADDGTLTFSPIGSTRRACERPLMDAESQFLQALEQTTTFTVNKSGTQLTLILGEESTLTFALNT